MRAALVALISMLLPAGAAEPLKVRFGILSGAAQTALFVAVKKGFFAKHGFDVEVHALTGGVQGSQALAAGQVDWSAGGIEPTIIAAANRLGSTPYAMYAKGGDSYGVLARKASGIVAAKDLAGKRVALVPGTATVYGFELLLQSAGLAETAVQRVNSNYTTMGQLLIQGAVDAIVGIEPYLTLVEEKMHGEAVMVSRLGKFVQGGGFFIASDAWVTAHPGRIEDAVKAIWEAEQYVRHNLHESAELYAEFIKSDSASIEPSYKYLTFDPLIDEFTARSFDRTAEFLFREKRIPSVVTNEKVLAEARRIGMELSRAEPQLLK